MPRIHFHQQLDELRARLLAMAALAQQNLECVLDAYRTSNLGLCEHVMDNEQAINRSEREVDELAYDLLAMEQPMAIDLRFILAVIKINGDLERIGDQCVNIADRVRLLHGESRVELPIDIERMGEISGNMIRGAIQSLMEADAFLAASILGMDDQVDDMNRDAYTSLMSLMMNDPEAAPHALNALIICRNLERIADHATNIAEDVIFWVRGADIRHGVTVVLD
jgi:phosphate transport system protein